MCRHLSRQETSTNVVLSMPSYRKIRIQKKRYYAEHREELLLKMRKNYHANPQPGREAARRRYAESKKKGSGSYYARHRSEVLLKQRERYHTNPEPKREYARMKYALNPEPKREAASRNYYAAKQRKLDASTNHNNSGKLKHSQDLEVVPNCILQDIDVARAILDSQQVEGVCPDSVDHVPNVACQGECVNQDLVDLVSGDACQSERVLKRESVCHNLDRDIAGHSFLTIS